MVVKRLTVFTHQGRHGATVRQWTVLYVTVRRYVGAESRCGDSLVGGRRPRSSRRPALRQSCTMRCSSLGQSRAGSWGVIGRKLAWRPSESSCIESSYKARGNALK